MAKITEQDGKTIVFRSVELELARTFIQENSKKNFIIYLTTEEAEKEVNIEETNYTTVRQAPRSYFRYNPRPGGKF